MNYSLERKQTECCDVFPGCLCRLISNKTSLIFFSVLSPVWSSISTMRCFLLPLLMEIGSNSFSNPPKVPPVLRQCLLHQERLRSPVIFKQLQCLSFPAQSGWSLPFSLPIIKTLSRGFLRLPESHFPSRLLVHSGSSFCNYDSRCVSLSCQHLSSESGLPHANQAWRASLFSLTMWLIAGIRTWGLGSLPWETCSLLLAATTTNCCLMSPG